MAHILDDCPLIVCSRVANLPQPKVVGSQTAADCCGEPVWLAPSSYALAVNLPVVCDVCIFEIIDKEDMDGKFTTHSVRDADRVLGAQ